MEQCIKRPPEKILIMPTSPTSPGASRSAVSNAKKPGRARTSLLSIISGGEKKSTSNSISSAADEQPLSPSIIEEKPVTQEADTLEVFVETAAVKAELPNTAMKAEQTDSAIKVEQMDGPGLKAEQMSPPVKVEQKDKPKKSVPPPTLAKTFKGKPPPTAAKPPKRSVSQASQSSDASSPVAVLSPGENNPPTIEIAVNDASLSHDKSAEIDESNNKLSDSKPLKEETNISQTTKLSESEPLAPAAASESNDQTSVKLSEIADNKTNVGSLATTSPLAHADPKVAVISPILRGKLDNETQNMLSMVGEFELSPPVSDKQSVEPPPPPIDMDFPPPDTDLPPPVPNFPPPISDFLPPIADLPPPISDLPPPVPDFPPPVSDLPPPVSDIALPDSDLPPPVSELPPPNIDSFLPDATESSGGAPPGATTQTGGFDDMEFPPPPDMDSPIDPEANESVKSVDAPQIQQALDKIISKYDTSNVTMNRELVNNETRDAYYDPNKQGLTTQECSGDSVKIPSHDLDHLSDSNMKKDYTDSEKQSAKEVAPADTAQQHSESDSSEILAKKALNASIPPSEVESLSLENSAVLEDDALTRLITPPTLPPTSSFSALEADVPKQQLTLDSNVSSAKVTGMGDSRDNNNTLTVDQHLDDNNAESSSSSTATHSPPFNTSSESGDSGVYSIVGETVPVKLRPTTNDNRKPDYSVPMFERYSSGELKRVTFREAGTPTTIPATVLHRSAAEENKIKKTGLSEDDISQAELFYKGHKTEVMACPCLATLYFAESNSGESVSVADWKAVHIGIPVLIYDTGVGKRSTGLSLVFAEKGTGFLLWKTVINYESRWEVVEPVFHRLRIPGTADKLAGMAFQDETSAESFYNYFKTCTSDPEKNVLNNPNIRNKKKKEKKKSTKKKPTPLPNKTAISKPCQFTHVTQLKQSEEGILALAMVPPDEDGSEDGI